MQYHVLLSQKLTLVNYQIIYFYLCFVCIDEYKRHKNDPGGYQMVEIIESTTEFEFGGSLDMEDSIDKTNY